MNTGFVMLPREVENRLAILEAFDYKLFIRILSNAVFTNQYEHNGIILNKGEWFRSLSLLQQDMKYIENNVEIVPSVKKIRCSLARLQGQALLTYRGTPKGTVIRIDEALINQCFPQNQEGTRARTRASKIVDLGQYNNKVLNTNNNVLNNKDYITTTSNNNLDSKVNFFDTFLLSYGKQPSAIQIQDLLQYLEDGMEEDLLCHAIQLSARTSNSVAYLWGVLRNWTKDGIKTLQSAMTVKKSNNRQVDESEESERKRSIEEFGW